MAQKKNRRNAIIAALAVLVVALAVGGTIAWLTATDQLTNQFTVGSIGKPEHPSKPDGGRDEDEEEGTDDIDGYLFETEWTEESYELKQGVAQDKNPNVGIAKGNTENPNDAFVFLFVENNSLKGNLGGDKSANLAKYAPYFYLEHQWTPVTADIDGDATAAGVVPVRSTPGNAAGVAAAADHEDQTAYVNGLFMFTNDVASATLPQALSATNYTGTNTTSIYTGELFEDITIPNDLGGANVQDVLTDGDITVHAFIYAYDAEATGVDGTPQQALEEAIAWAGKIVDPGYGA